jgi:uncharacterized membrane protein YccC
MTFTTKAKEPFRVALGMVLAYAIALSMDWDNPYWAGFAVAFVSLSTIGQSFNKAAMRMFGTLAAAFFALTLIAMFPQDRWLFMLSLSLYVGFCTYMMVGPKLQYFWNVCGFVCVIICMGGGADPVNAFATAVIRAQETGLGVLVYSLVSLLLWPVSSRTDFFAVGQKLAADQRLLFQACCSELQGDSTEEVTKLKGQVLQAQTRFHQLLDAAESDSAVVRESRREWRLFQAHVTKLTETIGRWHGGFSELQAMKNLQVFSNLDPFIGELDSRLVQTRQMLADQAPARQPDKVELVLDKSGFKRLSHFERATLAVFQSRLQELDRLTRMQFETVSVIKGFGTFDGPAESRPMPSAGFLLDPDRMLGVFRVMLTMWLAYLVLIYVDSIPGGAGFVTMTTVFAMITASMPQFPVKKMFAPIALSVAFASLNYLFVMPHLSTFFGLGLLLFVVTFAIGYLFAAPQQALAKTFGLAMFVTIASVNNQQTYSFMVVATNVLMWPLMFLILSITANVPCVMRPEKYFLRLLNRYFRSLDHLLCDPERDQQLRATRFARWKHSFHLNELASIPVKLGAWAKFLDYKTLAGTSPPQVQAVIAGLQELSGRIRELIEERQVLSGHLLLGELQDDARNWRSSLQQALQSHVHVPGDTQQGTLRKRLNEIMQNIEVRIRETLDTSVKEKISNSDAQNFYRLLGAYQGMSKAAVAYARSARDINWEPWREERF